MGYVPPPLIRIDVTNMDSADYNEVAHTPAVMPALVPNTDARDLDRGYVNFYNWLKSLLPKKDPLE